MPCLSSKAAIPADGAHQHLGGPVCCSYSEPAYSELTGDYRPSSEKSKHTPRAGGGGVQRKGVMELGLQGRGQVNWGVEALSESGASGG